MALHSHDFAAAHSSFKCAADKKIVAVRQGQIGNRSVQVAVAGEALAAGLMPTFAYLRWATHATGDVSCIKLWDATASGISHPSLRDAPEWQLNGEGWRVSAFCGGRFVCEERSSNVLWLDRKQGTVIGCFEDARKLGCADRARPLQRMMNEFSRSLDIQEIHAAMVACEGRAILLVGAGGRGKSTAALDGLYDGMDFLGDDSVGLSENSSGEFLGHCLYASARVLPRQHPRWPDFADHWEFPREPELKTLLQPEKLYPHRIASNAKICVLAIPAAISSHRAAATEIASIEAFRALVHESHENRRFGLTTPEFSRLARMTKTLPCYRLEVGDDPVRVADACRKLIRRHA